LAEIATPVAVPLWLIAALAVLSAIAIIDRVLSPLVRIARQRRADRRIEELNTRLRLRIQSFKLTERRILIDRIVSDPDVIAAAEAHAAATGIPVAKAVDKARRYAREIVPSFSAYTYFRVGARLARRLSQALYRVRLGYANDEALRAVDPDAAVVFVINHRSNMDYVLVTYMVSRSSALSYAVGEWAQVWLLRDLIRSMGAYFIRRNSGDPLYRKVLSRYVSMATSAGVVQAVFPEGGLSRDGALRPPKVGLISYMVQGFDPAGARDIVFVPVGVNYDRVLEDRNLTAALALAPGEEPRFRFDPLVFVAYLAKTFWRLVRGRLYRNGYACVSFGTPVSLRTYLAERRLDFRVLDPETRKMAIDTVGADLMQRVGSVIPALPVALVAAALTERPNLALTEFELKGRVAALMTALEERGAYVHVPRQDRAYAVDVGLRMLELRGLVERRDGTIAVRAGEGVLLAYYANSIRHLVG
jgi:glycerol-3-phosphate O-acyltransferase